MVTLLNTFYKKKILHLTKQSTCVKHRKQPRNRATIQQGLSHLHDSVTALKTQKPFTPQCLCPGCGAQPHPAGRTQCPTYRVSCHNCKKLGHFSRVCRSKPVHPNETKPPWPSTSTLQSAQPDIPFVEQTGLRPNHHDPLPLLFNLPSQPFPLLNKLVCLISTMSHLLTLRPS